MTLNNWLVIIAIITGPILAIQIQNLIGNRKTKRNRQMAIFRTLMTTRATPLSYPHVEALNMIDIEFHKKKKIVEAWKLLLDNFEDYPQYKADKDYYAKLDASNKKSIELLADLLYEMAKELKYDFDIVHLKRGAYGPRGHSEIEMEQFIIRKSLIELFSGKTAISVKIIKNDETSQAKKQNIQG